MSTLAQFRSAIASKIGLDNTASSADQTLIDSWVNEGVTDILLQTHVRVRISTMALTSGTYSYTLDSSILMIRRLHNSNASGDFQMTRVTVSEMDDLRQNADITSAPASYYTVDGNDLLLLFPTPGSGETLTVYYVPRPTALSVSSDTPSEIPSEWHKAVEYYALREAADYDNHAPSQFGARYDAQYQMMIRRIRSALTRKGSNRLPKARLNTPTRVSHDPGADSW